MFTENLPSAIIGMSMKTNSNTSLAALALFFSVSSASIARLSDEDLAKKRGGWYPTGIPVIAYSTDTGFGYGPALFLYDNGGKEGPHFADSPYEKQFILEYFTTTRDLFSAEH